MVPSPCALLPRDLIRDKSPRGAPACLLWFLLPKPNQERTPANASTGFLGIQDPQCMCRGKDR